MPRPVFLLIALLSLANPALAAEPAPLRAFLESHCYDCHDAATKKQGLDLASLKFALDDRAAFDTWVKVLDKVKSGEMPPKKKPQPAAAERDQFAAALHESLLVHNRALQQNQGRTVLRRLNRVEWSNTVRDLLGVDLQLELMLPEDTPLHGFDTVAEGLRLSALHMEKYLEAVDAALDAAIELTPKPALQKQRYSYKDEKGIRKNLDTPPGTIEDPVAKSKHVQIFRELDDAIVFFGDGYSPTDLRQFTPRATGDYRIRVGAYAFQSRGKPVGLRIYAHRFRGRRLIAYFDIPADKPREAEIVARLEQGEVVQVVPYDTGYDATGKNVWNIGGDKFGGTGLAVQWVEFEGPRVESWPPPSVANVFGATPVKELPANRRAYRNGKTIAYELAPDDPRAAAKAAIERFAGRAFRRPLETGEADVFVKLAHDALDAKQSFENATRLACRAILTSPQFLLFDERPGRLDDFALASRLSYFLWSTLPDEALLKLAAEKKLGRPDALAAQVERMLNDPRAAAFTRNFVGQWLDLRRIDATSPDARLYPEFDEILQHAMVGETEAFFREVLAKDLSVASFIQSDFVMANRRIAEHYGIAGVFGEEFRRVALPKDSPRGGVLTQASVLKVTANGTVTSPVMRGAWVMKRLLGDPPPAPPPNVGSVEPDTRGATTIREQLAKHRNVESCASCHVKIDPPGFALESFDVIGGWRERYRSKEKGDKPTDKLKGRDIHEYRLGLPVDASGEMSDGRKFADVVAFKQLLLTQQDQIARALARNLLVYATGAGVQYADRPVIDDMLKQASAKQMGLRTLVHAVAQSEAFRSK